jgi:hypothetical protein
MRRGLKLFYAAYYTKFTWRECGGLDPTDLGGVHLREADLSAMAQCAAADSSTKAPCSAAEALCSMVFHFAAPF